MEANLIYLFGFILAYVVFLFTLAAVGFSRRRKKSASDFFNGGKSFGPFLILFTIFASFFSTFTFIGMPGFYYSHGIVSFVLFILAFVIISPAVLYFSTKVIRRLSVKFGTVSPVETVTKKYSNKTVTLVAAIISLIFIFPNIALQSAGVSKIISQSSGGFVSYGLVLLIFMLIVFLYSRLGGMRVIVWSDAFQGVLMVILFVLVGAVYLSQGWGFDVGSFFDTVSEKSSENLEFPGPSGFFKTEMLISMAILFGLAPLTFPFLVHRSIIVKDDRSMMKALRFFPLLVFLVAIPGLFIGLGAAAQFPDLPAGDNALASVLGYLDMPLVTALVVLVIMAAAMSTVDSIFLTAGLIVSRDVFPYFTSKKLSELKISNYVILIFSAIGFFIALNPPPLIISFAILSTSVMIQLLPTIVGGLFMKSPSSKAAIFSMLLGVGLLFLFRYVYNPLPEFHPGIGALIFNALSYFAISAWNSDSQSLVRGA